MNERRIFDTKELRTLELVTAHQQFAQEQIEKLGEKAVEQMITVVRHPLEPIVPGSPTPKPRADEIIEGGIIIPKDFQPAEASEPGCGDRLIFLEPKEATIALDKNGESIVVVNKDGKAKTLPKTPRKLNKLQRKGITLKSPDPYLNTQTRIKYLAPSM